MKTNYRLKVGEYILHWQNYEFKQLFETHSNTTDAIGKDTLFDYLLNHCSNELSQQSVTHLTSWHEEFKKFTKTPFVSSSGTHVLLPDSLQHENDKNYNPRSDNLLIEENNITKQDYSALFNALKNLTAIETKVETSLFNSHINIKYNALAEYVSLLDLKDIEFTTDSKNNFYTAPNSSVTPKRITLSPEEAVILKKLKKTYPQGYTFFFAHQKNLLTLNQLLSLGVTRKSSLYPRLDAEHNRIKHLRQYLLNKGQIDPTKPSGSMNWTTMLELTPSQITQEKIELDFTWDDDNITPEFIVSIKSSHSFHGQEYLSIEDGVKVLSINQIEKRFVTKEQISQATRFSSLSQATAAATSYLKLSPDSQVAVCQVQTVLTKAHPVENSNQDYALACQTHIDRQEMQRHIALNNQTSAPKLKI